MTALLLALLLADPTQPLKFQIETAGEEARNLSLDQLDSKELKGTGEKFLVQRLVRIQQLGTARPSSPRGQQLLLANGDRLAGEVVSGDDSNLKFRPSWHKGDENLISVPLNCISAIWLSTIPADSTVDPAQYAWLDAGRRRDTLLMRNNDRLSGAFEGFTNEPLQLRFKPGQGEATRIVATQVRAMVFEPGLARIRPPKTAYARLTLEDGSRLSVRLPTIEKNKLKATTLFGSEIEVPIENVIVIDVLQNGTTYLSDLKPEVQIEPFNTLTWPVQSDLNTKQKPLSLQTAVGVEYFAKGVGTHSTCTLKYRLTADAQVLSGWVGLDPSVKKGSAQVSIRVDGKSQTLPEQGVLQSQSAIRLRIDLTGAKELELSVTPLKTGDVQADVNWCDLKLSKITTSKE
jgi:hypothetical protein